MASSGFTMKEEKFNLSSKDETENDVNQDGGNGWEILEKEQKNPLEIVLREMKKFNANFDTKMDDMRTQIKNEMKEEMKEDVMNVRMEFEKRIDQLKKSGEMNERALSILFAKVNALRVEANQRKRKSEERNVRVVQEKNTEIGVVQEWFRMDQLVEMTEEMMRKVKNKLGAAHERFRESQEKMRETYESFIEPQDKMAAQKKREAEEKMVEKRVAEERRMNDNATKSPSRNNSKDKVQKMETPKKKTENKIKEKLESANLQMTPFNLIDKYGQFEPSLTRTITEFKNKMDQGRFSMTSEVFKWTGYPVSARATLELTENDDVSMFLEIENVEEMNSLKVMPQVYYLLKGQGSSRSACSQAVSHFLHPAFLEPIWFYGVIGHKSHFTSQSFIVDDSVTIEVYVEPPSMAQKVHSYNGTLDWVIEDFSKKLRAERKGLIWDDISPYFYTGPRGFKVQAHMSLYCEEAFFYIGFLVGEFDNELPLTFPHEIIVTLVNRKNPEKSITKTVKRDASSDKYGVEMGSLVEVEKVLENDTLLCSVTIKAL